MAKWAKRKHKGINRMAILFGSVLGFAIGVIGCLFFGMSLAMAFGVYLGCGIGVGALKVFYGAAIKVLAPVEQPVIA